MSTKQNITEVLRVLACPECKSDVDLVVDSSALDNLPKLEAVLATQIRTDFCLKCPSCERNFPVTEDGIPVMWSDSLRQAFHNLSVASILETPDEATVKTANIKVYDAIIEDYDAVGIHADGITSDRMISALHLGEKNPRDLNGWHLDVGCGSGNVLRTIQSNTGLEHFVGIDISLGALRLVMKQGYLAVVGDAESLPVKSNCITLLTASSVLHHLFQPQNLIFEAQRVLKVEGVFLTDFDPSSLAADWSWPLRMVYKARLTIYRSLNALLPTRRVSHKDADIQRWNSVAEFHNRPGAGFSIDEIKSQLSQSGLVVRLVFPHNTLDRHVTVGKFVRPNRRHLMTQLLSGRNPFSRRNSDTILTISQKVNPDVPL